MFKLIKRVLTQNYYNKKAPKAFEHFYKYSSESEAYLNFCTQVHQLDFPVQNNLSQAQFQVLEEEISSSLPKNVLDLGCGTGDLFKHLSKKYKFKGLGLDFALLKETSELKKANFETFSFKENQFDLIYSIDSLYMMNNLRRTIKRTLKSLRSGGKFIIFYTATEEFALCPMAKPLRKLDLDYSLRDFTEDDSKHWNNSDNVLNDMKKEFLNEGNVSIWKTKSQEAQKNKGLHASKSLFRYIITITK